MSTGQKTDKSGVSILEILERVLTDKVSLEPKDYLIPGPIGENEERLGDLADHPKLLGLFVEMRRLTASLKAVSDEHQRLCHAEGAEHSDEDCEAFMESQKPTLAVLELLKQIFFLEADKQFGNSDCPSAVRNGTEFVRINPIYPKPVGQLLAEAIGGLLASFPGVQVFHVPGMTDGAPSPSEGRRTIRIRRPGASGPN
jgi:hypothetical protein